MSVEPSKAIMSMVDDILGSMDDKPEGMDDRPYIREQLEQVIPGDTVTLFKLVVDEPTLAFLTVEIPDGETTPSDALYAAVADRVEELVLERTCCCATNPGECPVHEDPEES